MKIKFIDIDGNTVIVEADDITKYYLSKSPSGTACVIIETDDIKHFCDRQKNGSLIYISETIKNHITPCNDEQLMHGGMY